MLIHCKAKTRPKMLKMMAAVNKMRTNIRVDGEDLLLKELKAVFICQRFLANQTDYPL